MARYFLHVRDAEDVLVDPEGQEFATLDALRQAMLSAARELISVEVSTGHVNMAQRIEAEDEDGVVHILPFTAAVRFTGV